MRIARLIVPALLVVLVVVAAASSEARPATPRSGLYGIVSKGPVTPVCRVGEPCDAPAAGVLLTFLRTGVPAARTRSGAGGRYRIRLAPGRYAVRTDQRPFGTIPRPARATVPRGRFGRMDFFVETGIR